MSKVAKIIIVSCFLMNNINYPSERIYEQVSTRENKDYIKARIKDINDQLTQYNQPLLSSTELYTLLANKILLRSILPNHYVFFFLLRAEINLDLPSIVYR